MMVGIYVINTLIVLLFDYQSIDPKQADASE